MFQFLTHVELSRSMAAILEMPQYVAYQKNAAYAFINLSAKSHSFNILRTMDGLSCPTTPNDPLFLLKIDGSHSMYHILYFNLCLSLID